MDNAAPAVPNPNAADMRGRALRKVATRCMEVPIIFMSTTPMQFMPLQ